MGFLGDSTTTIGVCIGIPILIIILLVAASFIMDIDTRSSIENNKTIELNGVQITVPESNNFTINESASIWNINDSKKFDNYTNIREGNAWHYHDNVNNISLYVADANRTAYSDEPDFSRMESFEGELERTHIEKKNVGDKVVVLYITEGKGLSKLIIDSAVHT